MVRVKEDHDVDSCCALSPLGLTNLASFLLDLCDDRIPLKHSYGTLPVLLSPADAGNETGNDIFERADALFKGTSYHFGSSNHELIDTELYRANERRSFPKELAISPPHSTCR